MKNSTTGLINKLLDKKNFFVFFALSVFLPASSFSQNFWEEIYLPDSISCHSILVDNFDSIYIGTGSNYNTELQGVYKSDDNGLSWFYKGPEGKWVTALSQDSEGLIYAGSYNNIYRSDNEGSSWNLITDKAFGNITEILIISSDTIFVSSWSGIIHSFDRGLTWDTSLLIYGNILFQDIEISSQNELFTVAVDFMQDTGGVYKSIDWGKNWEKVLIKEVTDVAINSFNEIFITTQWEGIFKSNDSGETWINIDNDILDIMTIAINNEDIIFVGCQNSFFGGAYVSYNNGEDWENISSGLNDERIHEFYIDSMGFIYSLNKSNNPHGLFHKSIITTVGFKPQKTTTENDLIIYPNPLISIETLNVGSLKSNVKKIELLDMNGQVLYTKHFSKNYNENVSITLPHIISRGIYYIRICISDNIYGLKKLIVI